VTAGATVLVDTGPLVALFDPSDRMRPRCEAALAALGTRKLVTSLAVLTEATYLLGFSVQAQTALLSFVAAGAVDVLEFGAGELGEAAALMVRYAQLPMDLADASLVVLAGRLRTRWIFTLDRRDFSVYRVGRRAFRLIPD
jgi:uncharacterized protein